MKKILGSRRIIPTGKSHLWIQNCEWIVLASGRMISNDSEISYHIDGRTLIDVSEVNDDKVVVVCLHFDRDIEMQIKWEVDPSSKSEVFSIRDIDGWRVAVTLNGKIERSNVIRRIYGSET